MNQQPGDFAELQEVDTILLTTFRRDGTPVHTPVHLAVEHGRAYFRTYDASGKFKRLRRNPVVEIAPSTIRGKPLAPSRRATVRILAGDDARAAAKRLSANHPVMHGWLIPMFHRLRGWKTMHMELILAP